MDMNSTFVAAACESDSEDDEVTSGMPMEEEAHPQQDAEPMIMQSAQEETAAPAAAAPAEPPPMHEPTETEPPLQQQPPAEAPVEPPSQQDSSPGGPTVVVAQAESDDDDEDEIEEVTSMAVEPQPLEMPPPPPVAAAVEEPARAAAAVPSPPPQLQPEEAAVDEAEEEAKKAEEEAKKAEEAAAARAAAIQEAADKAEAEGKRKSRRTTAGQGPERFVETYTAGEKPKRARQVKEDAPPLPPEAPPAGPDSEWVSCDLCQKWRIVKCSEIDALPENAPWICSMNSDVRHNSCSAQQRLWMSHAPDDGERVQPKGFTSIATLEAHAAKISANEAEELQLRLPMAMQEAGWIVLPSGGTFASHRLDYAYLEKSDEEQEAARKQAAATVAQQHWTNSKAASKAAAAGKSQAGKGRSKGGKAPKVPQVPPLSKTKEKAMLAIELKMQCDVPYFWDKQAMNGWWEQQLHDVVTAQKAQKAAAGGGASSSSAGAAEGAEAEAEEEEVVLSHGGMRLWLRPGSEYHKRMRPAAAAAHAAGAGEASGGVAQAPPVDTGPKRSARVADRQVKEQKAVAKALENLCALPLPGLPAPGSAAAATAAAARSAAAAAKSAVPAVMTIGADFGPGADDDAYDPFDMPVPDFSAPVTKEETKAHLKSVHEAERKRQSQQAAEVAEEIAHRVDELTVCITRGERLDVDPSILAQAHEYLAVLGASMRKAKSESGGGSSGEAATAYRGVTSKPVSLAGVTHTLYESNYEHKLLGTFITAPEAAAAFAKHVHMTYGLNAPEEDPFARPDTASAAARSSASAIPGGSVGLAILARLAAAAPTATAGSSSSAPAKKYSEVKYQSHAPKDGKGGNKGKRPAPAAPQAIVGSKRPKTSKDSAPSWTERSFDRLAKTVEAAPEALTHAQAQVRAPPPAAPPPQPPPVRIQPPPQPVRQPVAPVVTHASPPKPPPAAAPAPPAAAPAPLSPAAKALSPAAANNSGGGGGGPPPVAERHPTIEGKLRVLSANVCGVAPGEMFALGLPDCAHTVRIPFPKEACTYITFKFGECPKCRKAREAEKPSPAESID